MCNVSLVVLDKLLFLEAIASLGVTFSLTDSLTHSLPKVEKQYDIAEIDQYSENESYWSI